MFEGVDNDVGVVSWRYDDWHSAGFDYRLVIVLTQALFAICIISSNADYRLPFGFRKSVIYIV